MRIWIAICPECGEAARGTIDKLKGCAEFGEISPVAGGPATTEYSGNTEVWWDEQRTIMNKAGKSLVICPNGHEWYTTIEL